MNQHNVLLENGTVGTISEDAIDYQDPSDFIGECVAVKLSDENGNIIEQTGVLAEVL